MSGDLARAKEQLAWLRSRKSDEADELAEKIEASGKSGAAAVEKAEDEDEGAAADSTGKHEGAETSSTEGK